MPSKTKKSSDGLYFFMAGVTGFEPVLTVLETAVLPLTPYPCMRISKYSIDKNEIAMIR